MQIAHLYTILCSDCTCVLLNKMGRFRLICKSGIFIKTLAAVCRSRQERPDDLLLIFRFNACILFNGRRRASGKTCPGTDLTPGGRSANHKAGSPGAFWVRALTSGIKALRLGRSTQTHRLIAPSPDRADLLPPPRSILTILEPIEMGPFTG